MRGRGRGRGRGGRGQSGRGARRGRGGPGRRVSGAYGQPRQGGGENEKVDAAFGDNPQAFFTGTASPKQHLDAQNNHRAKYCAALAVLAKTGIQIPQNVRARALAIAWGRGDVELASTFLKMPSLFGLVEVLKAITLLDAGRQIRVLERRYKSLQLSATRVHPQKMGKLKSDIDNMTKLKLPLGSASGAVCKHVAKWVKGFTAEEFDFYAAQYPKEPWKKLADICHFHPEKDFPSAPWFLPFCFGMGEPPKDSLANICQNLSSETINDLVRDHNIPYSMLKTYKDSLTIESKMKIAQNEIKLDTVLWYYQDLACREVDNILSQRLADGHPVTLSNGKLLERLLAILIMRRGTSSIYEGEPDGEVNFFTRLIEVAEPKLTSIRLPLESPIVVIGDASPSMSVAIRTSTIIASLLTAICSAKLVFFDRYNRDAPYLPKNVKEMLKLAMNTRTTGSTAPAASLYPFYEKKEIVKTFIIVTDEEENASFENYRFAPLFQKYYTEVYPAKLVFVSFLHHQHAKGQMITELQAMGYNPKQLRLDGSCPDLTKLDTLFGELSSEGTSFEEQIKVADKIVQDEGIGKLFEGLNVSYDEN